MRVRVALTGVLCLAGCAQAAPVPPAAGAVIVVRGFSFELPGLSPAGASGADAAVSVGAARGQDLDAGARPEERGHRRPAFVRWSEASGPTEVGTYGQWFARWQTSRKAPVGRGMA
jgi:hypothetical protein